MRCVDPIASVKPSSLASPMREDEPALKPLTTRKQTFLLKHWTAHGK